VQLVYWAKRYFSGKTVKDSDVIYDGKLQNVTRKQNMSTKNPDKKQKTMIVTVYQDKTKQKNIFHALLLCKQLELIKKVIQIDCFITIQCFAVKLWVQAFIWFLHQKSVANQAHLKMANTFMTVTCPMETVRSSYIKKCTGTTRGPQQIAQGVDYASDFPLTTIFGTQLQEALGKPWSTEARIQGFAAIVLIAEITRHPQRFKVLSHSMAKALYSASLSHNESEMFW